MTNNQQKTPRVLLSNQWRPNAAYPFAGSYWGDDVPTGSQKVTCYLTEVWFEDSRSWRFDEHKLRDSIDELVPDPDAKGFGIVDWEEKRSLPIHQAASSLAEDWWMVSTNRMIELLEACYDLRPRIKWGPYGLPACTQGAEWFEVDTVLWDVMGVCYPVFYMPYGSREKVKKLILKTGTHCRDIGIPIYPHVCPRNMKTGQQYSVNQFIDTQITPMVNQHIDGVLYWDDRHKMRASPAGWEDVDKLERPYIEDAVKTLS